MDIKDPQLISDIKEGVSASLNFLEIKYDGDVIVKVIPTIDDMDAFRMVSWEVLNGNDRIGARERVTKPGGLHETFDNMVLFMKRSAAFWSLLMMRPDREDILEIMYLRRKYPGVPIKEAILYRSVELYISKYYRDVFVKRRNGRAHMTPMHVIDYDVFPRELREKLKQYAKAIIEYYEKSLEENEGGEE